MQDNIIGDWEKTKGNKMKAEALLLSILFGLNFILE